MKIQICHFHSTSNLLEVEGESDWFDAKSKDFTETEIMNNLCFHLLPTVKQKQKKFFVFEWVRFQKMVPFIGFSHRFPFFSFTITNVHFDTLKEA